MSKKIIACPVVKRIFYYGVISLLFVGFLFTQAPLKAQTPDPLPELPAPGLMPGDFFYFLDEWGEIIEEFFIFDPESKARLQVGRALERIAEAKATLAEEKVNIRGLNIAIERQQGHIARATEIMQRLGQEGRDIRVLAAQLDTDFGAVSKHLERVFEESKEVLEIKTEQARQELERKFLDPAFIQAMEAALLGVTAQIDEELGRPLEGFTIIEDEKNVDVDDDTYSATFRAESPELVDLAVLKDRILNLGTATNWESGNIVLDDDSLDITFEKTFGAVEIEGIFEASVTISATQNSPEDGMTAINYDIDITLESVSEHLLEDLLGLIDRLQNEADDSLDDLSDVIDEQMDIRVAAERTIREVEQEKEELMAYVREEGIVLPGNVFSEFDGLLTKAKSAFAIGNLVDAKNFAEQVEKSFDKVDKIIDEIEKTEEALRKNQRKLDIASIEERKELEKEMEETRRELEERLKEIEKDKEEVKREMPAPREPVAYCKTDRDCAGLICTMLIGQDTPQCDEEKGVCFCGPSEGLEIYELRQ